MFIGNHNENTTSQSIIQFIAPCGLWKVRGLLNNRDYTQQRLQVNLNFCFYLYKTSLQQPFPHPDQHNLTLLVRDYPEINTEWDISCRREIS